MYTLPVENHFGPRDHNLNPPDVPDETEHDRQIYRDELANMVRRLQREDDCSLLSESLTENGSDHFKAIKQAIASGDEAEVGRLILKGYTEYTRHIAVMYV